MDEYDQSGEYQEPEFYEDKFYTELKTHNKMPGTNYEHQLEWRKKNPDKHRTYMREYMRSRRSKK